MAPHYDDIPELADLDSGRNLIRVPMEQNVPFTRRVRALVDTPEFQRLSHISQLGLVSRVYPGATHTRFEHALGVYHNSLRYLQQLRKDPRFVATVSVADAELLIVTALLHDIGHWPFCHPIEDMGLPAMPPHEAHAAHFLKPDGELAGVLRDEWRVAPEAVVALLTGQAATPATRLLQSILSGPIDIDKMDYLDRDSLHCGVPYGRNFDRQRLMQSLVVNANGDGLAITSKGKTAAELMVFARYVMFSEVYWHHAVRAATNMFARAFYHLSPQFDLEQLFTLSDAEMIAQLRDAARGGKCETLLEGVFGLRRVIYKRAAEFTPSLAPDVYRRVAGRQFSELVAISESLAGQASRAWGIAVQPTEILVDAPPPHREVEFAVDIYFPKTESYRSLREVSPVVEALALTQFDDYVKRVRIFIHPRHRERANAAPWGEWVLNG
jgi:uncharacterized protein